MLSFKIYEGIDNLQDDYIMHNMLDMIAIEQKLLECTSCKTEQKAVARCADCAQFLCPNCVSAHLFMRCFENHCVVEFDDITSEYKKSMNDAATLQHSRGLPIHKPLHCKLHAKEILKFFCHTCQVNLH